MLVPAMLYKEEIEHGFLKDIYTEDYLYYIGFPHDHTLPEIVARDNEYQFAIVDGEKLAGFLSYKVDPSSNGVYSFSLYSFDRGNSIIGIDLFNEMEKLVGIYHRIEWKMLAGNPVQRHYDRFCKKYNGNIVVLRDVCKINGAYRDAYIYEIITEND